jgi:ribosomal protein S18 acetylase RimI-like enzyme
MATQPIDYAALAKQYGAVASGSSPNNPIDYAALAKQYGAIASTPAGQAPRFTPEHYRQAQQWPGTITVNPNPAASDTQILNNAGANNPQLRTLINRQRAQGRSDTDIAQQLLTKGGVGDPAPPPSSTIPDLAHPDQANARFLGNEAKAFAMSPVNMANSAEQFREEHPVLSTVIPGGPMTGSMVQGMLEGQRQNIHNFRQDVNQGDVIPAVAHGIGAIPFPGAAIVGQLYDQWRSGDQDAMAKTFGDAGFQAVLGHAAAPYLPDAGAIAEDVVAGAPQLAREAGQSIANANLPGRAKAFIARPSTLQNFSDAFAAVPTQKPVITQAMPTFERLGIGPEKNVTAMSESVGAAQRKLGQVYDTLLPFVENRLIDANDVTAALEAEKGGYGRKGVVSSSNQPFANKIDQEIQTVQELAAQNGNGKLDFNDVRYLRDGMNGRTDFKSPQAEENFYRSIGDVYRAALDRMAPETTGINRDWANLSNAKFVADKNIAMGRGITESGLNKIFQPNAIKRVVAGMEGIRQFGLPGAAFALAPDALYHGAKFARSLPDRFRAAANYERPVEYPNPAADAANTQPAGLLGPASVRMPGVADPSGPMTSKDGLSPAALHPEAMHTPVERWLPPPSRIQTGGFAAGDDLVPVKDPETGRYVYVPRWTLQEHATPVRTTPEPEGQLSKNASAPATAGLAEKPVGVPASQYDGRNGPAARSADARSVRGTPQAGRSLEPDERNAAGAGSGGIKPLSAGQGVEVFTAQGPDGTRLAIAAKKGARGYRDFDPLDNAKSDIHNLEPDKLDAKLGSDVWRQTLAAKGYTPENVVGAVDLHPTGTPGELQPGLVYVHPAFRRQGVARSMYDAIQGELQPGERIGPGVRNANGQAFREAWDASQSKPLSGAEIEAERMLAEAKAKAAQRKGNLSQPKTDPIGEMARVPELSGKRDETFTNGQTTRFHIGRSRFDPFELDDENADVAPHTSAHVANVHMMEFLGRVVGLPLDDAGLNVGAFHFSPEQLEKIGTGIESHAKAFGAASTPVIQRLQKAISKARESGQSAIFVKDNVSMPTELKESLADEEFNHVRQRLLGPTADHLGNSAKPFVNSPLGRKAKAGLEQKLKYSFGENDNLAALEIGERLMRPGAHRELGLSGAERDVLAEQYMQSLDKEYGEKAQPVIARIRRNTRAAP